MNMAKKAPLAMTAAGLTADASAGTAADADA